VIAIKDKNVIGVTQSANRQLIINPAKSPW